MKKVISILVVALMLFASTTTVMAVDNTLDIEKVAIGSIKNSQDVQSFNRQVTSAQKNYADINARMNGARDSLRYQDSYPTVQGIILQPLVFENTLKQVSNLQQVVTNGIRLQAYQAYIDLLKENYALNIQLGLMNGFDAEYRKAQIQKTLGMISQSQFRLKEITYLKSKYRYNSAQKRLNSVSMAVNKMMGEDLTQQYSTLQDYNITPAAKINSLNDYVNLALANRAEIINAQSSLDLKKKQYEYGKAAIPTDFEFYKQQQEYAVDSAQNELDLAKIDVQKDITDHYQGLESSMKVMEARKDLNEQAVLNFQAAEIKYKNSQISLQEFDDAKVVQAEADINYKNSQFDAWLMQTTMNSACGLGYIPSGNASMSGVSNSKSKNKTNPTTQFNRENRN